MRRYGERRSDNDSEAGHGSKSSRARATEAFLEALRECTCIHGLSVVVRCEQCDAAFDAEEAMPATHNQSEDK